MADAASLMWLKDRLRQEEQAMVLRHQQLLRDLQQWKAGSPRLCPSPPPVPSGLEQPTCARESGDSKRRVRADLIMTSKSCPPVTEDDSPLANEVTDIEALSLTLGPDADATPEARICSPVTEELSVQDAVQAQKAVTIDPTLAQVPQADAPSASSEAEPEVLPSEALSQRQSACCVNSGFELIKKGHGLKQQPQKLKNLITVNFSEKSILGEPDAEEDVEPTTMGLIVRDWRFETFFGMLILVNALVIGSELQYNSYRLGWLLGWKGAPDEPAGRFEDTSATNLGFRSIDVIFGALFWIEILAKLLGLKSRFFSSPWLWIDLVIMVVWTVQILIVDAIAIPPTVLRIMRLVRLVRLVRFIRSYEIFDTLKLMICSVRSSTWVFLWSICLLLGIMLLSSVVMSSSLEWYMDPNMVNATAEDKLHTYKYFGSLSRSMVSMAEITLGNWVPICRHLMDNVTERYGCLIVFYRLLVVEGILKVISSIFLQQTMQCAANDDTLMIENKMRQRERFVAKMKRLIKETDSSGDGTVSKDEFTTIVKHPRVKAWLQAMELNIRDPDMFFAMLDKTGDGELDAEEIVAGMSVLKGPATQLFMETSEVSILEQLQNIQGTMEVLKSSLAQSGVFDAKQGAA